MPGAVGGDLLKAWYVTKHTDRKIAGVLSVFVDRLIGLVALVLMAVATYSMFVRGQIVRDAGEETDRPGGGLSGVQDVVFWALWGGRGRFGASADSSLRPGEAPAGCRARLGQGPGAAARK